MNAPVFVDLSENIWKFRGLLLFLQPNMSEQQLNAYRRIHFAVMAIEASAQKAHLSGKAMYDRLKRQDLIRKRLLKYYEQLHTQSLDWVTDDTLEALNNWEQEEKEAEQ